MGVEMSVSNIKGVIVVNEAVSGIQLAELQRKFHMKLPESYVQMLRSANGFSLQSGVVVYSSDELVERNETLEVSTYAPGCLAIGDDSGGRSILISFTSECVYLVGQGSMDSDDFEMISNSLACWLSKGCVL
ncbi:SMI1/KNR4 family protein [Pseudomonas bijieensis]|uniref:SMI1/KNR4 family protein n=2 Tax=Pseudomonas bijieensis TaxID=2681983 RepID=A0A6N1C7X4_9PSED|nr:SMI1/KNR4 family protein [Pseudomonas bijieensis]